MQLNELLAQIDALKAEIDQLRPLKPEVEHRIMQKFRLDWNYHSNAIEGNTLTLGETKAFLMEKLTASGKPLKDHLDIRGHNQLIEFLPEFITQKDPLTEAAIRHMHKILLHEPYETEAITLDGKSVKRLIRLGEYKTTQNLVRTGSGEVHHYATPEEVAPMMAELIEWHREEDRKAELHPVVHAALFHHRFLAIHPFDDGNGRLGRILMNLLVMRAGFPPAVVKLADRDPYVAALRRADAGELDGITAFIAKCVLDSESLYLRGAKGESIEDADDVDKAIALLKRELQAVPLPTERNLSVQQKHFEQQLIPFLERIDEKLRQFDELFAKPLLAVYHSTKGEDGMSTGRVSWENSRNVFVTELRGFSQSKRLLTSGEFRFKFDTFLRDGPNDFGVSVGFDLYYQDRRLQFRCSQPRVSKDFVYGDWLSEDEVRTLVNDLAKELLGQIERNLRRNRPG